jgi:predicted nucleic acid-binding protein
MYLVDTNIVSEAHRGSLPAREFILSTDPGALFLSVVTLGEIRRGIVLLERRDQAAARRLSQWLEALRRDYAGRILPVTAEIAVEWGNIAASRTRGPLDVQIAATSIVHGLTLVTRNTKDFDDLNLALLDPWQAEAGPT